MKTYLLTAITFLLITAAAQAQHVNIGIKGGLNGYTIKGDNSTGFDLNTALTLACLGIYM